MMFEVCERTIIKRIGSNGKTNLDSDKKYFALFAPTRADFCIEKKKRMNSATLSYFRIFSFEVEI